MIKLFEKMSYFCIAIINNSETFDEEFWRSFLNSQTDNSINVCIPHNGQLEHQLQQVNQDAPSLNSDHMIRESTLINFSKLLTKISR